MSLSRENILFSWAYKIIMSLSQENKWNWLVISGKQHFRDNYLILRKQIKLTHYHRKTQKKLGIYGPFQLPYWPEVSNISEFEQTQFNRMFILFVNQIKRHRIQKVFVMDFYCTFLRTYRMYTHRYCLLNRCHFYCIGWSGVILWDLWGSRTTSRLNYTKNEFKITEYCELID